MKGRVVAIDRASGRAALVIDGRVEDLLEDPPEALAPAAPEAIHWAKVERVAPALGAAFLKLGDGSTGWIRSREAKPGAMMLAQVSRWADPGKAAPLSDRAVWKGRWCLVTPGAPGVNVSRSVKGAEARARLEAAGRAGLGDAAGDVGLVLRTAALDAENSEIEAEAAALVAEVAAARAEAEGAAPRLLRPAPNAATRAVRDWSSIPIDAVDDGPDAFERMGVWDAIDALADPRVALPGGGSMSVEATAAMVAVDVNTGEDFSKEAPRRANLAACAELPRQLRMRGLGGIVLVDFAPLKKGARQGVEIALRRAFADDPVETSLAGWTPLGNFEMTRRRERRPTTRPAHG